MVIPEQPLTPPEPDRCDRWERLEHDADRYQDEHMEKKHDESTKA